MAFMIPLSLSLSCRVFVGNSIGEGKPKTAKRYYHVILFSMVIAAGFILVTFNNARDSIIGSLTDQETVIEIIYEAWPAYLTFLLVDGLSEQGGAVMLGLGRMGIGAAVTFVGFFIVGLPSSMYLAYYKDFEISGIWIGATLGTIFLLIFYNAFVCFLDWD